jgi:hypothetical protein
MTALMSQQTTTTEDFIAIEAKMKLTAKILKCCLGTDRKKHFPRLFCLS